MSTEKPSYKDYSIDELLEVKESIDREVYPDRFKEITFYLSEKMQTSEFKAAIERQANYRKYSTFRPRFWASLIDGYIIYLVFIFLSYLSTNSSGAVQSIYGYVNVIIMLFYSLALHTFFGQTCGKMLLSVKVVDYLSEQDISFKHAFKREIVPFIFLLIFYLYFFMISNEQNSNTAELNRKALLIMSAVFYIWQVLEIISMLFNEKSRALHDLIGKTVVVRL